VHVAHGAHPREVAGRLDRPRATAGQRRVAPEGPGQVGDQPPLGAEDPRQARVDAVAQRAVQRDDGPARRAADPQQADERIGDGRADQDGPRAGGRP
jgi:hypothetical protein